MPEKLNEKTLTLFLEQTNEEVDVMSDGDIPLLVDDVTGDRYIVIDEFHSITKFGDKFIINLGYSG